MDRVTGWTVAAAEGDAATLHAWQPAAARQVRRCHVTGAAVVLGSTQADPFVGGGRAPAPVVRRRSGGGAVWVAPGAQLWVEVVVPAHDPLHRVDVEEATWFLGGVWASALTAVAPTLGVNAPVEVWSRGVSDRALGRVVCFGALGPGEVTLGGRKVVGISQRRTRGLSRFQCLVCGPDRQDPLGEALGGAPAHALAGVVGWEPRALDALFAAFVAALPA